MWQFGFWRTDWGLGFWDQAVCWGLIPVILIVLPYSMKLWAIPCRTTQDRWVMVESSNKMWSTGEDRREWQATSVFLPWEPYEQYEKAKRYDTERWTPQVSRRSICYWRSLEKQLQKEHRGSKGKTKIQLWMWLVIEARFDAVMSNIA